MHHLMVIALLALLGGARDSDSAEAWPEPANAISRGECWGDEPAESC